MMAWRQSDPDIDRFKMMEKLEMDVRRGREEGRVFRLVRVFLSIILKLSLLTF